MKVNFLLMKEKLKFIAGGLISAVLLFGLGYVGVQSVLKKRFQNKTPEVAAPQAAPVQPSLTPEEKLKQLEKKVAKNPKNAHLHFLLAEAYKKTGSKILALLEYRKAMELNPKSKDAEHARAWITQETLLAKADWKQNVSIRYQLSMQLESYQSITGSLASISQAVELRDQQFKASAAAGAAGPAGLTPTPQAGTGSQLPSFAPGTSQPMFIVVPMTSTMQPGAPVPANPTIGIPTSAPPPAGYAPTQQPPPSGGQLPPGFTSLQSK